VFHYFPQTNQWVQYGIDKTKDGLASPTVRSILIDEKGIVWVGTELGLHRFDAGTTKNDQLAINTHVVESSIAALERHMVK
jgi:ligand-binding sensor domain-containing protein